jgi:hypothetical protein
VEVESKQVANLRHAFSGLRLSLRGRIGLRSDLIDFEEPRKTFALADKLSEDFMWNVIETIRMDRTFLGEWDRQKVGAELTELLSGEIDLSSGELADSVVSAYDGLNEMVQRLKRIGQERLDSDASGSPEAKLYSGDETEAGAEFNYSALELLANICVRDHTLSESKTGQLFVAKEYV